MKVHELKTVQPFFNMVKTGYKKFELRNNDRDFMTGDILILKEWDNRNKVFVGDNIAVRVTYVLDQFVGLQQGYCIMSISDPI
jgi:ParB family chromosome partitioning protein